jgi:hypothetical protein
VSVCCKRAGARIFRRIPSLLIAACPLAAGCRSAGASRSSAARKAYGKLLFGTVALACLVIPGCHDVVTTWSARVQSPDGGWVAIARTQQFGGPGTAGDLTTVYLQRHLEPPGSHRPGASEAQEPMQILVFSHQWRTMRLNMKWLSPRHLEVVYGPSSRPWDHVDVDFQVVKIAGIDVSLQKLNSSSAEPQQ